MTALAVPRAIPGLGKFSLCAPAKYGSATGAVVGVIVWALVSYVPAFHNGVPQPLTDALPFVLAWAGHTAAAWIAPHPAAPGVPAAPALSAGRGDTTVSITGTAGGFTPVPPSADADHPPVTGSIGAAPSGSQL